MIRVIIPAWKTKIYANLRGRPKTDAEQYAQTLIAACARESSAQILAYAEQAGQDPLEFLMNVATVLAASALAAQPEEQLLAASRHLQHALGLVHCQRTEDSAPPAEPGAA